MDTYENDFSEPAASVENTPQASPFADAPFIFDPPAAEPPAQPRGRKKRSGRALKSLLCILLAAALAAGGCCATAFVMDRRWQGRLDESRQLLAQMEKTIQELREEIKSNSYTGNGNSISGSPNTGADGGLTPGQLYARCVDSVVAIKCTVMSNVQGQIAQGTSSGSGFILSEDGYVVSNCHVVDGATEITVTTHDGESYTARLVGADSSNDLALLKLEAQGLKAAELGSSSDLIIGDMVAAIGNPLGELTSTLTVGYVSAKDRTVTTDGTVINMLQTDAAINPGNSGGPLFNMKGQVVGITTAKYSGTTSSGASIEGIGFAIPIDDVKGMIGELMDKGYISTPYMGVTVNRQSDGMGAYVVSVTAGGAASRAGMKAGDIIVGIGDHAVTSFNDLSMVLRNFKVGEETVISVYRDRKVLELTITFDEKPRG